MAEKLPIHWKGVDIKTQETFETQIDITRKEILHTML
jgi:hypothetical protein